MADVSEAAAQIELLDQNLRKTHVLSSRMTGILAHFDARLNKLERTILPLHNSTQSLTRTSKNIDATLAALASMRVNQQKAQSDEVALLSMPNFDNLESYMGTLDRTLDHINDLEANGLQSSDVAMRESTKLAETGFKNLCAVLTRALQEGSSNTQLSITATLEQPPSSPSEVLTTFPELSSSGLPRYIANYPFAMVGPSKQLLDDAFRAWGDTRGAWMKRGVELYARRVAETGQGGNLAEGILLVAQMEHQTIASLLPTSHPLIASTLITTLSPSLSILSKTLTGVTASCKSEPLPWKAYGLWESLASLVGRWEDFFADAGLQSGGEVLGEVMSAGGLKGLCLRSLPEAIEGAKIAPMVRPGEMPSVAVSQNTIDTVAYLLKLPEHQHTIEDFLFQLGDRKWLMGAAVAPDAPQVDGGLLEHFIYDVCAALIAALEQRSKAMRRGVGAIFLVNNISYIRDNLILSSTSTISDLLADAGEDLLNKAFRSAKASYLEPFNQLLSLLTEPPAVAAPTSSRLNPLSKTDSERQTFKDGFTRFWETLEGIEMNHRQAKLVPGDTKDRLKEEVTTLVGRAYKGAVVKHAGNLGPKYIRCTPDDLDQRITAIYK